MQADPMTNTTNIVTLAGGTEVDTADLSVIALAARIDNGEVRETDDVSLVMLTLMAQRNALQNALAKSEAETVILPVRDEIR